MMLERPPMEDARQALLDKIMPLESEALPTMEAVKRILAADIIAPHDLPPYRQAAMDGFAVSLTETKEKKFTIKKILEAVANKTGHGVSGKHDHRLAITDPGTGVTARLYLIAEKNRLCTGTVQKIPALVIAAVSCSPDGNHHISLLQL
jgi:hypothetical protein